ncbi:MAG: hypothetical protein IJJ26_08540, partial [Victivallales bacterium]|nr:hypothetical protein [Victivallales bacterium]
RNPTLGDLYSLLKNAPQRIFGKKENKDGFAHSGNNCHDPYSQRKNGEQEWISAFPVGENARKSLLWQLFILRERIFANARLAGRKSRNEARSDSDCHQTS